MKFTQVQVLFPDEPPLFFKVECQRCGWTTGTLPSVLTEQAVRKMGFKDFEEYVQASNEIQQRGGWGEA
jgi:hypothetical protein